MATSEDNFKFDTAEDFGFSTMDTEKLKQTPEIDLPARQLALTNTKINDKLKAMFEAIKPLLANLEKDADTNPYIHWPNRGEKIKLFREKLEKIMRE